MMAPFARREGIRTLSSGRSPDLRGPPEGAGERLPASHDAVTRGSPYLAYRCGGSAGIESVCRFRTGFPFHSVTGKVTRAPENRARLSDRDRRNNRGPRQTRGPGPRH